jgi:hypothetical protein
LPRALPLAISAFGLSRWRVEMLAAAHAASSRNWALRTRPPPNPKTGLCVRERRF